MGVDLRVSELLDIIPIQQVTVLHLLIFSYKIGIRCILMMIRLAVSIERRLLVDRHGTVSHRGLRR